MKYIGLGILLLIVGLIFVIMGITEPDFSVASRIFSIICGAIFLALPCFGIFTMIHSLIEKIAKRTDKKRRKTPDSQMHRKTQTSAEQSEPEDSEATTYPFLASFRSDFSRFFITTDSMENTPLQSEATQLYWHILMLRKKRLDKKGIFLEYDAKRKNYSGVAPVSEKKYFDGNYMIEEISESVEVTQKFIRNGESLFKKEMNRIAHYVITSAKKIGDKMVICPNCGAKTSKENLIDGCDYCGTKFTVRDLENKVSAFRLRDDYEIQYEKYRQARSKYNNIVFWGQAAVYFIIICIVYICMFSDIVETAGNVALAVLFIPLTSAIASGMFAYLGLVFFWIAIFPLIQIRQSVRFFSKRRLDRMKARYAEDTKAEANIRKFDPLFSVAAFYSELTNKLACIHYSDTKEAANAFFSDDRYDFLDRYRDVVDMDTEDINVIDFKVENGLQQIKVNVETELLIDKGQKLSRKKEKLHLTLIKDAECRTQAICGPEVLKCKGCGSSIALEQGKVCTYCGRELDLKKYDWIIRDYEVI